MIIPIIYSFSGWLASVTFFQNEMERENPDLAKAECRSPAADSLAAGSTPGCFVHGIRKGGG